MATSNYVEYGMSDLTSPEVWALVGHILPGSTVITVSGDILTIREATYNLCYDSDSVSPEPYIRFLATYYSESEHRLVKRELFAYQSNQLFRVRVTLP